MPETLRIQLFGCPIDNLSFEETLGKIDSFIEKRQTSQQVVVNVDKIVKLQKDAYLKEIICGCDIVNADGMPLVWASKLFGTPLKGRVTGIDLMFALLENGSKKGYRFFLLGAKEEVLQKTLANIKNRYQNIRIAGFRNGYWSENEEPQIVKQIRDSNADILFVAVSSPKKEIFLKKYLDALNVPFSMGVGGSFDIVAGLTKRAPIWMQKTGLEWLFRLIQEPKRMWKRYLINNTLFMIMVVNQLVSKVFRKKHS